MSWRCLLQVLVIFGCCSATKSNLSIIRMSMTQGQKDEGSLDSKERKTPAITFSFAKHFQDNMVLQRAPKRARVYGFSPDIGAKVVAEMTVTPEIHYYYTTQVVPGPEAGVGSWVITLDPMSITDPISITFVSEAGTLSLKNVLFGDVWLCSGQSNMEFTVPQMFDAAKETADAHNYPNIRLFTVSEAQSSTPLYDLRKIDENWSLPSNESLSHGAWHYFSAVCWLYGKYIHQVLGYPIGLIATDWGGTPVEAWSSPDALSKCHLDGQQTLTVSYDRVVGGPQNKSCLWNAMIHPLLGMTIYGAIWYQGEDDASLPARRNRYNCTFPAMIDDWRLKFNQASQQQTSDLFPFGFVQLSAYRSDPNITVGFPDIRWHQTADYGYVPNPKMPNTFMAVAMDLPDFTSVYGSVHPRDKKDVGARLALSGLGVAYNKRVEFQGPFPVKVQIFPQYLILDYGHEWTLTVKSTAGFELSCQPSDGNLVWYPAPIAAHNSTSVSLINACKDKSLYAIRYAWRESPCSFKTCAVYSTVNSLPAAPFKSYFTSSEDGKILRF